MSAKGSFQRPRNAMAFIDYIISRVAIFIVLCVIWMSINGQGHVRAQSSSSSKQPATTTTSAPATTTELMGETRPVNLIVINDNRNKIANESVTNSLKALKKKNSNLIGKVTTITIDGEVPKEDLERICEVWDREIKEEPSKVPDLVLDTTRTGSTAEAVGAFTAAIGVPTLSGQFDQESEAKTWRGLDADQSKYLVQIMPPLDLIPEAIRQLTYQMNISNAGVIYDDSFTMDDKYKNLLLNVATRHLLAPVNQSDDQVRRLLLRLRELDILNYFILGGENTARLVLNVAQSLNYTGIHSGWYIMTEDEFEPSCECKNMSVIMFKPVISSTVQNRLAALNNQASLPKSPLTSAFYYDLTRLSVTAMSISIAKSKWPMIPKHLACQAFNGENTPIRGFNYYKELIAVAAESEFRPTFAGISWGKKNGRNWTKFNMTAKMVQIVDGKPISSENLGIWPSGMDSYFQVINDATVRNHTAKGHYRISTVIKAPFVMYDPKTKIWSGYCIDLIDKIAAVLNFTYVISEVADKRFGLMNEDGKWDGLIQELLDGNADIALGTLTVMAERENVIDFTVPIYDLVGFSILMQVPQVETSLFKFLTVLEDNVWLCILGSYFFTSFLLWVFDRWSPYSYQHKRDQFTDGEERREFSLRECLWFSMTSLTPQGGGEAPMNLSGRLVAATWWLFGFIIIASYTANLAAFLTVSRLETPVQSVDDLSKQYKVQYASIKDSETYTYFKRMADIERRFYDIWGNMSLNDSLSTYERAKLAVWDFPVNDKFIKIFQAMTDTTFPRDLNEAVHRVRRLNPRIQNEFALIGDATDIRYLTMTNCDLLMIGTEFSRKPYAMAVQSGAPLKDLLNNVILQLLNDRKLEKLKNDWWERNPNKIKCDKQLDESEGISIANIGGVFIVILVGIVLACFALAFEFYWYRYRPKRKQELERNASLRNEAKKASPIRFTLKPMKITSGANQLRSRF